MTIGQHIRKYRIRRAWTLRDLGARSGVSYNFIWQVEQDRQDLSCKRLQAIAKALGVKAGKLLGEL